MVDQLGHCFWLTLSQVVGYLTDPTANEGDLVTGFQAQSAAHSPPTDPVGAVVMAWERLGDLPDGLDDQSAWRVFENLLSDVREERLDWIDPTTWRRQRSDLLLGWQRLARAAVWSGSMPAALGPLATSVGDLLIEPDPVPSGAAASDPVVPICYELGIRRIDYCDRDGVHLARAIHRRLPPGADTAAFVDAFWDWHDQAEEDERDVAAPLAQTVLVWEHRPRRA